MRSSRVSIELVDLAHAACADRGGNRVWAKPGARRKRHVRAILRHEADDSLTLKLASLQLSDLRTAPCHASSGRAIVT